MSPLAKTAFLWGLAAWLCVMSVLASVIGRADGAAVIVVPILAACGVAVVAIGTGALGVKMWPAIAGWAFLVWQLTVTVFVMAVMS